ncbi:trypsin-like peptidase domain-containing protein [Alteromonas oceanisediminis]|uniref:trypsin-like peptidase domain-containing protein n=1 Tax=Alteromonas oceanisediminis TaxID=2836180 RepID=UPI001BDA245C|nr:trypsin-like peptidase domain-containing protein [Alteromonas oceanisediminis]MBT0585194.1 trypsin-like peptidase domain-containing protein [Alteromonas oceanisediminis]
MSIKQIVSFVFRSVLLGCIVAALILLFVPDLRVGNGFGKHFFDNSPRSAINRLSYYDALSVSAPAVVNIYSVSIENTSSLFNPARSRERTSLGSGVVMTETGYILTCYHVVNDADSINVQLQDGRFLEAQMVGFDVFTDLAVLKVNADNLHVMPQLEDTQTRVGDLVMAIGNPYDLGQTITHGIVSKTGRNGLANFVDFVQTDAVLNQGNSGGALVDSDGYLIGITNASFLVRDNRRRVRAVDGVNFAIPYELAIRVMNQIIATGKVTRGQLGFNGSEFYNRSGIVVTGVQPGSPADTGGLQVNDLLVAIDGEPVESAPKALDLIAETPPGTIMTLEVMRGDNQRMTLQVVVGELSNPQ